jgi:predicted nucleic acid-binding protein
MKHLFLDTNIIIDVLSNRKPFSESGAKLFDLAEKGQINLYMSALSYSTIYYIIKRTCSHKEMTSTLKDLEAITETLAVTKLIISKSLNSVYKDFEDSVQYHTAISHKKVSAIVTRNGKDFKNSDIAILTPEEALSIIESSSS